MSAILDLESAVKAELAKPGTRQAIEGVEKVVLEAVKNVLESAIPGWLRPLIGGLVDSLAEKGIAKIEDLTDGILLKVSGGGVTLIREYPTPNSDQIHTKEDLPEQVKLDLGIKG